MLSGLGISRCLQQHLPKLPRFPLHANLPCSKLVQCPCQAAAGQRDRVWRSPAALPVSREGGVSGGAGLRGWPFLSPELGWQLRESSSSCRSLGHVDPHASQTWTSCLKHKQSNYPASSDLLKMHSKRQGVGFFLSELAPAIKLRRGGNTNDSSAPVLLGTVIPSLKLPAVQLGCCFWNL